MNSAKFVVNNDPLVSIGWLKGINNLFKVVPCAKEENVVFVIHMLQGAIEVWWDLSRVKNLFSQGDLKIEPQSDKKNPDNIRQTLEGEIETLNKKYITKTLSPANLWGFSI